MRFQTPRSRSFLFASAVWALTGTALLTGCTSSDDDDQTNTERQMLIAKGETVYSEQCSGCHGANGEGSRGPQVANSDYVMGDKTRLIHTILAGNASEIQVNGVTYPGGGMPSWSAVLDDEEVAGVLSYLRGVLNDTLYTNCVENPSAPGTATCTKTARTPAAMEADYIKASEVAAVRATLAN
jgi:mono/diheme cytochrome c family protein